MIEQPTLLQSDNPRVPQAKNPFRHVLPVQTRFTDIDLLGHVNNNAYFSLMDLAKIDYFNTAMGRTLTPADLCMVVVHVACDFFEPAYFNEQLKVWTTISHIGHRSITLEQRITDASGHSTKCVGTTVLAGFDPATAQGAPIDESIMNAVTQFENRALR